jgi:hypothetical protein
MEGVRRWQFSQTDELAGTALVGSLDHTPSDPRNSLEEWFDFPDLSCHPRNSMKIGPSSYLVGDSPVGLAKPCRR